MKGRFLKGICVLQAFLLAFMMLSMSKPVEASTNIKQQYKVSAGVDYQDNRISTSTSNQAARVMKVNLNDPYTKIEVGLPNPLNKMSGVTAKANASSKAGHQVVGAVNGSFFGQSSLPMYLIANNNKLINAGILPKGKDQYANEPIAFGVKNGAGIIDHYNLDLHFEHNGKSYPITASNKSRSDNQLILYTSDNPNKYTNTNSYGMEVVVTDLDSPLSMNFGSTVSGVVTKIRNHGDTSKTEIPENGFVLSAHGTSLDALKDIQNGDRISLTVDIDSKWKGASFMLASGPMLVENGKVSLSMDPNSSKAKERAPRTAVALDKTGKNVYFVTVDGRQSGYSNGMNLTEFAQYLVSLGVDRALNMDGGGSTAMAIRNPGDTQVKLVNSPSDGHERAVSTTLMAISTAPTGQAKWLNVHKSNDGVLLKGSSIKVVLDYMMDQYYNPLKISEDDLKFTSSLGSSKGNTFTANKAGKGSILVQYNQATKSLPIEVVDKIAKLEISPKNLEVRKGDIKNLTVKGYDEKGRQIIMSPNQVKWAVSGSVGAISSNGTFQVTASKGSGNVTASYGTTKATVTIKIAGNRDIIEPFDNTKNWTSSATRATVKIGNGGKGSPVYSGTSALKFDYNFTTSATGTAAAYLNPKKNFAITSRPHHIGMRVFGDGNQHWLRGLLVDGKGEEHTVNFTEDKGLSWEGWKYVNAIIPSDWPLPIQIKQIYLAEPHQELKGKGTLYFDQLQVVYDSNYHEPLFNDTGNSFWAEKEVSYLIDHQIISGFADGKFQPNTSLNRVQAAIILTRALGLNTNSVKNPQFNDVPSNYRFYKEIAAAANAGIVKGKNGGKTFDTYGTLTRAEMAVILQRAFKLSEADKNYFKDNLQSGFAYSAINSLASNNITKGYNDGTYKPSSPLTRAEFSVFLYRALPKE